MKYEKSKCEKTGQKHKKKYKNVKHFYCTKNKSTKIQNCKNVTL